MLLSVVLCLSIVGLLLFVPRDTNSTWCSIGKGLLHKILNP